MDGRQKAVPGRRITYADAGAVSALALAGLGLVRKNPLALAGAFFVYKATRKTSLKNTRNNLLPFLTAPGEIKKSVCIVDAPDAVYASILDLQNLEAIFPAAHDLSFQGEQQARLAFGMPLHREIPVVLKIVDTIEPKIAELEFYAGDRPMGRCTLTVGDGPQGEGTTVEMVAHTKPILGVVGRNLIKPVVTFAMDTYLFRLKQLCETGEIARIKGDQ